MPTRVLYIEDDSNLAESVIDFLEADQIVCDHATNGDRALRLIAKNEYDVLVSDINMPGISGYELCGSLRQKGLTTPIILVSALKDIDDKLKGFELGSDDYLVKPFELRELKARIHALSQRRSTQVHAITIGTLVVDTTKHKVTRNNISIELSPSEWTILVKLAKEHPEAVSSKELEIDLWGDDIPNSNALKVHIHNLRLKIDKPFESKIIKSVHNFGFFIDEK